VALIIGALDTAVITAVLAKKLFSGGGAYLAAAAPAVPLGPKVLVARKSLPVGTIIDAESLAYQAWPQELVQGAYYTEGSPDGNVAKMIGTVVRNPITAGQPITKGALVGPNDRGFLAAALGPGMRAVTVPVSVTSGVGGFIFPGDRVDMVLTQTVAGGGEGSPLRVSETIVRNLRVLATDQRIDGKNAEGQTEVRTFATVTFEATPKISEKIAVAQSLGSLSLALRSIADNTAELERAVAAGEVNVPSGTNPVEERKMLLAIANRPVDTNTTYTTGGDVSRFQRSSVPSKAQTNSSSSGDSVSQLATAMMRASAPPAAAPSSGGSSVPSGPAVRVARGNNVTYVPVGAR
jgi:pilus assembly protein CpaB